MELLPDQIYTSLPVGLNDDSKRAGENLVYWNYSVLSCWASPLSQLCSSRACSLETSRISPGISAALASVPLPKGAPFAAYLGRFFFIHLASILARVVAHLQ